MARSAQTTASSERRCRRCSRVVSPCFNFCPRCGAQLRVGSTRPAAKPGFKRCSALCFAAAALCAAMQWQAVSAGMQECFGEDCSASESGRLHPDEDAGSNLYNKIGRLFSAEQRRQRLLVHDEADGAENGPKEISVWCPTDPQVKIVDLSEAERDRDLCMVLNLNAPNLNARLVLNCNQGGGETSESAV